MYDNCIKETKAAIEDKLTKLLNVLKENNLTLFHNKFNCEMPLSFNDVQHDVIINHFSNDFILGCFYFDKIEPDSYSQCCFTYRDNQWEWWYE